MTGHAEVHYRRLCDVMSRYPMNVIDDEIDEIRRLHCAVDATTDPRGYDRLPPVTAPPADAERWNAATGALQRSIARIDEQEEAARRHLRWVRPAARPFWKTRHALRNRRLRATYDSTMERLRDDVRTAYRTFREQAGDLTPYVHAELERQERESREWREQRERETRERAPARAAAMAEAAGRPVWGYTLVPRTGGDGSFTIHLQTVEEVRGPRGGVARTGLTPEQVQAALAEERLRDRYTSVMWSSETELALTEWHASGRVQEAWRELTGVLVERFPRIAEQASRPRNPGVSGSDYGGFTGFGGY
ncbi:hypothetical protein ACFVVL_34275 [Kitasatospora sp. NPDC058115]|uniref:hypothetical protein n=1 Tax=Kitasatospora sp. NPDC058115 TaxID=3346347 RepID=UPI0036D986C7